MSPCCTGSQYKYEILALQLCEACMPCKVTQVYWTSMQDLGMYSVYMRKRIALFPSRSQCHVIPADLTSARNMYIFIIFLVLQVSCLPIFNMGHIIANAPSLLKASPEFCAATKIDLRSISMMRILEETKSRTILGHNFLLLFISLLLLLSYISLHPVIRNFVSP